MSAGDWKPTVTVELSEDGGGWVAECRTLDYFAGGKTVEEAKKNFAERLEMTAILHRQMRQRGDPKISRGVNHHCLLCNVTGNGLVMPNFDWRFVEGAPA